MTLLQGKHVITFQFLTHLIDDVESSRFADVGQVVEVRPNLFIKSLEGRRILIPGVELV